MRAAALESHHTLSVAGKAREKATFFFPLFEGLYPETSYATLEFGDGSRIHIDSRFDNCSITLGEGAELTIGEAPAAPGTR